MTNGSGVYIRKKDSLGYEILFGLKVKKEWI
jgi:hypothetical protein